jgi:hypothetical protein
VKAAVALAGFTALLLAPAPSTKAAGADRPRVALSVSPARLVLRPPDSRTITVRNDGAERVAVDVRCGNADIAVRVAPARLVLGPGGSASLTVRATRPRRPEPGSHHALLLLTTRALRGGRVSVHLQLAVRIRTWMPGRVVRRLAFGAAHVHRRHHTLRLFVAVANRGNVTLELRNHVTALLIRHGKPVARLDPRADREVLRPGARTTLALRYRGRVRGLVTAAVRVRVGARLAERRYRLRL